MPAVTRRRKGLPNNALSLDEVNRRIRATHGRDLRMVSEYHGYHKRNTEWECLKHSSHPNWFVSLGSILTRRGCPVCNPVSKDLSKRNSVMTLLRLVVSRPLRSQYFGVVTETKPTQIGIENHQS